MTPTILQKIKALPPAQIKPPDPVTEAVCPAPASLLTAVLESFSAGLMILSPSGECLHSNQQGHHLCRQLQPRPDRDPTPPDPQAAAVAAVIWPICESLIESRSLFPDQQLVLFQSVTGSEGCSIRIRVQWIEWADRPDSCLLVTLENETHAARVSARLEAHHFRLTERETDVWMLKRADYTYDEIAAQLFITTNTVKRHLKSIYAKRKQVLDAEA